MKKTYYVAKASKSGNLNFVLGQEKVSETVFNDLLQAKLKELLTDENQEQYERCLQEVTEALESKKPVTIGDRNFEIKFTKERKS